MEGKQGNDKATRKITPHFIFDIPGWLDRSAGTEARLRLCSGHSCSCAAARSDRVSWC